MITIDEIKNISFRKSGMGGYRPEDVDEFIDDIIAAFERQNAEKADLMRKMDILATKVEQYRADEETVRNALLSSQKIADAALKEAKDKATYIIKAAEKKSRKILTEAGMATEREKDKFESVQRDAANLRKEIVALYKKHLKVVDEFPTEEDVKKKRDELDAKYPFEPVDEIVNSVDEDIETEMEKAANSANAVPVEQEKAEQKPEQKNEKFDQLKFGDNYDVEE